MRKAIYRAINKAIYRAINKALMIDGTVDIMIIATSRAYYLGRLARRPIGKYIMKCGS